MPPSVQLSKESIEAELVDMSTAARMLSISRQAVYQHIVRGHLQSVHPGVASLVWVRQVKDLRAKLESYREKNGSAERKGTVKKESDDIKKAVDKIVQIRSDRDTELKSLKEMYGRHIAVVRGATQKSKLRKKRDGEIRELRRSYLNEIDRLRKSVQNKI